MPKAEKFKEGPELKWATWDQAAIAAAVSAVIVLSLRRARPTRVGNFVMDAAQEFGLLAFVYSLWRVARELPLVQDAGAIERARTIVKWQDTMGLPTELSLQQFVRSHDTLAQWTNAYYGIVHVPALFAFMIWLFVRQRQHFSQWRNGLVILTAFCLIIRFWRVAPPRFLPDLGYIDLSKRYGFDLYGEVGTGVSDQFAAMPSIHVGWAAVISFGIVAASSSKWRWLFLGHVIVTILVVSATGHHWWLDGIVAIALLGLALGMDWMWRTWRHHPEPVPEVISPGEESQPTLVPN